MQSSPNTDRTHMNQTIETEVLTRDWLLSVLRPLPPDPVAVLDIDSTIMDTAPRNRAILTAAESRFPALRPVIPLMSQTDLGWGAADTAARRAGLSPDQKQELRRFWAEGFFSNDWLSYDEPYPGVGEFLRRLHGQAFHLVYLTGRDRPNMADGTLASFTRHKLPVGTGTTFLFKPDAADDDIAFKRSAVPAIRELGTPVLAIDNEPGNANTFRHGFSDALILLIDTITSPNPEPLAPGIHLFRTYPSPGRPA